MKKYKVLNKDLCSPFQGFKFEIGKEYICDNFDDSPDNDCSYGFYATELEGIIYSFKYNQNQRIFECDVAGKKVEIDNYKCRYEKFKLVKEISYMELKRRAKKRNKKLEYNLAEILFPINPFEVKNKGYSDKTFKKYIKQWASVGDSVRDSVGASVWDSVGASVWASVGDSVWASVWDSVWDSVRDSVWASVWDSVGDSVRDSVWAYISSFFPNIKLWKYINHEEGQTPFEPVVKLWKAGYVISFDGETYKIHTGKKAEIIYEIKKNEL